MREVPDSHDGDGRARVKELELREHIPGQVDPRDESGDHGCIEPYQPDALLQAVARLHHDRPVESSMSRSCGVPKSRSIGAIVSGSIQSWGSRARFHKWT